MSIWQILGLSPSESDKKLKELVSNTYTNVNVVGRGTVNIDPVEVRKSREFKEAQQHAKAIVNGLPSSLNSQTKEENIMTIEHQEDLGFGLITPVSVQAANEIGDVTFGKYYAKTNTAGDFYDDIEDGRGSEWYIYDDMVDVIVEEEVTPTHNIEPGDWTCWQNDQELYAKLEQAFINAGFVDSVHLETVNEMFPIIGCWEFKGFNYYETTLKVDAEFRTYRTPEYLLSALNAQPKPKTDKEIEIETIIKHFSLDKKGDWDYAETLYKGGFRVSNVANTERWEQENNG